MEILVIPAKKYQIFIDYNFIKLDYVQQILLQQLKLIIHLVVFF